jgi:hypothetical protein
MQVLFAEVDVLQRVLAARVAAGFADGVSVGGLGETDTARE